LPGFWDRRNQWRSTLASTAISLLLVRVGVEYLLRHPPCFLDEPYVLHWLLSYCDSRQHRGTLYRAAGFKLYRTNARGIQTWRITLPPLGQHQDAVVRAVAAVHPRSIRYRAQRAAASVVQPALL